MIKNFKDFLFENEENRMDWREMEFSTPGEKSVSDLTEESFLSKDLIVI